MKVEKTNRYGRIWLVTLLALAGWFGFHSMSSESGDALVPITVNSGSANQSIATKNIEEIQVGDRVYAENPTDDRDDSFASNINHFTWRKLTLEAEKIDGGITEVTLLRPQEWVRDRDAQVGGQIHLHLAEVGVDGPARVLAIEPCPEIQPGVGQIVTGTFKHLAANVINLQVDSLDEPIGVTANHPIWSHDRQEFVLAGNLQRGERLRTLNGLAHVNGITERGPPETVYNFEVHLHHVYHVTQAGLLVHNSYDAGQPPLKRIHSDSTYERDPKAKSSLEFQRTRSTEDLIESLRPGQEEPLTTKVDGRIFQGNTRIRVLQERGVDVDRLPRVVLPSDPLDNPFFD